MVALKFFQTISQNEEKILRCELGRVFSSFWHENSSCKQVVLNSPQIAEPFFYIFFFILKQVIYLSTRLKLNVLGYAFQQFKKSKWRNTSDVKYLIMFLLYERYTLFIVFLHIK